MRPQKEAARQSLRRDAPSPPPPPAPEALNLFGGGALLLLPALVAAALAGIGLILWQMVVHGIHEYDITWVVAGGLMMLTVPIRRQLLRVFEPRLRLLAVRLAWVPLVMAIDAWFALKMPAVQGFSALVCGWYQAWAVYSLHAYLAFCIAAVSAREVVASPRALSLCRLGALLYVAVQAVVSAAAFATTFARRYGDGSVEPRYAFLPLTICLNIAQAVALLALALPAAWFDRLRTPRRWRTGAKVAWLLTLIFGAYWQEMIIYALLRWNVVATADSWTLRSSSFARVAQTMHAWILCVEMFFAAALFGAAFAANGEETEGSQSGKEAAPTREGVGFMQGLAGALGLGAGEAPPLLPPPPPPPPPPVADSELGSASISAHDSDAEARAAQEAEEAAASKAERRRRRERSIRLSAGPSGRSAALSAAFSDSARLDTLEEAPPAEEHAEPAAPEPEPEVAPSAEPEPMLQPPRARRRAPLPYALSAMPVVLAPPERDVAADGRPAACSSGVYSSILGWMGMGQPSHPYDGAPPPVALPPPGLPLRVAAPSRGVAVVRDVETGASAEGEAAPRRDRPYWERAQERALRPRQSTSRPASETLEQLVAKLGQNVKGTWRPEGY